MKVVELSKQPVELFKILKFEGLADNGGAAKALISEGRVLVNGVVETRKRKQIVSGDVIELDGEKLRVHCATPSEPAPESAPKPTPGSTA